VFYEKVFPTFDGFAARDNYKVGDPQKKSDGQQHGMPGESRKAEG